MHSTVTVRTEADTLLELALYPFPRESRPHALNDVELLGAFGMVEFKNGDVSLAA
jgi:hypothetical protein